MKADWKTLVILKTPCQLPLYKKKKVLSKPSDGLIHWSPDSFMQIHCVEIHWTIWNQLWLFNVFFDIYTCVYIYIYNFFLKHTTHTSLNTVRKGLDCICGILVAFRFIQHFHWNILGYSALTTKIFEATAVTTTAEEKLKKWFLP